MVRTFAAVFALLLFSTSCGNGTDETSNLGSKSRELGQRTDALGNGNFSISIRDEGAAEPNIIKPRLTVTNLGSTPLSNFSLHFYFTAENDKPVVLEDYYTPLSTPTLQSLNSVSAGLYRVVYSFAGQTLSPGATLPNTSGDAIGIHYQDWSAWNRLNDPSLQGVGTAFVETDKVVLVDSASNVLYGTPPSAVGGTPPSGGTTSGSASGGATQSSTLALQALDEALNQTNSASPRIRITNNGTSPLSDFFVHYYFTATPGKQPAVEDWHTPNSIPFVEQVNGNLWRLVYDHAGFSLAPGATTPHAGGNVVGLHNTDWSTFDKSDDWSWQTLTTTFQDTNRIVVINSLGNIVYGTPPPGVPGGGGGSAGAGGGLGGNSQGGSSGQNGEGAQSGQDGQGGQGNAGAAGQGGPPDPNPSGTNHRFFFSLPRGVNRQQVTFAVTGGDLLINDSVRIVETQGGFGDASAMAGGRLVRLGAFTEIGNAWSDGWVQLASYAHAFGAVRSSADIVEQAGAVADGGIFENQDFSGATTREWDVFFPDVSAPAIDMQPDTQRTLAPGAHPAVEVKSRAVLTLSSGLYTLKSLTVHPEAVLSLNNANGPILIYIENGFTFRGTQQRADGATPNVLFGVAGSAPVNIENAFRGLVIAPNAKISFSSSISGHAGSFFAHDIEAHQSTTFTHEAFEPELFCVDEVLFPDPCSQFCACGVGGPCSTNVECAERLFCGEDGACACQPDCAAKQCGDDPSDGCGGVCAGLCAENEPGCVSDIDCEDGLVCIAGAGPQRGLPAGSSICMPPICRQMTPGLPNCGVGDVDCGPCQCLPDCTGRSCGSDGCGGTCGPDPEDGSCEDGFPTFSFSAAADHSPDFPPPAEAPVAPPGTEAGTLPGTFNVTARGTASYSIPIDVPPGRQGLQPNLSFQYNSTKQNGLMGVGWGLGGLSTIQRCAKTVEQDGKAEPIRLQPNDALCLDGQRLIREEAPIGGNFHNARFYTELESFQRIRGIGDVLGPQGLSYFKVETKNGLILWYGRADVLIDRGAGPGMEAVTDSVVSTNGVRRVWALAKVEDRAGNFMVIRYEPLYSVLDLVAAQQNEIVPTSISYGGHPEVVTPGSERGVRFKYHAREDARDGYVAGGVTYSRLLLESVETFVGRDTVSRYKLDYSNTNGDFGETRLSTVQRCGFVADEEHCLPATTFEYGERPLWPLWRTDIPPGDAEEAASVIVLDSNGDGRDDFITGRNGDWKLSASGGPAGLPSYDTQALNDFPTSNCGSFDSPEPCVHQNLVLDLNRDGRDDILAPDLGQAFLSDGDTFTTSALDEEILRSDKFLLGDTNGDGLRDLIACDSDVDGEGFTLTQYPNKGDGTFETRIAPTGPGGRRELHVEFAPLVEPIPEVCHGVPGGGMVCIPSEVCHGVPGGGTACVNPNALRTPCGLLVVDLDRDGDDDILSLTRRTILTNGIAYPNSPQILKDMDEGFVEAGFVSHQNVLAWDKRFVKTLDINGDGLLDFLQVGFRRDRSGIILLHTNTGTGFVTTDALAELEAAARRPLEEAVREANRVAEFIRAYDFDGDGRDDVLIPGVTVLRASSFGGLRPVLGDVAPDGIDTVADIDGSGDLDLVRLKNGALDYALGASARIGLLTHVTDGLGKRIEIEYEHAPLVDGSRRASYRQFATDCDPNSIANPSPECAPDESARRVLRVAPLVSAYETRPDANGGGPRVEFSYEQAEANLGGRGWLSFRKITSRTLESGGAVFSGVATSYHTHPFWRAGLVRETETRLDSSVGSAYNGDLSRKDRTTNNWVLETTPNSPQPYPWLQEQEREVIESEFGLDGPIEHVVKTTTSSYEADDFGNLKRQVDEVHRGTTRLERSIRTVEYRNEPIQWLIGLPTLVSTSSTRDSETGHLINSFDYDERGLLVEVIRQPDNFGSSLYQRQTLVRDPATGNVESIELGTGQGEAPRVTTIEYDSRKFFEKRIVNAANHATELQREDRFGGLLTLMDANGVAVQQTFDPFGRVNKTVLPTHEVATTYDFSGSLSTVFGPIRGRMTIGSLSASEGFSTQTLDGFGRVVHTTSSGWQGAAVTQEYFYDWASRITSVSLPHLPSDSSQGLASNTYDGRGRLASSQLPNAGAIRYAYVTHASATSLTANLFEDNYALFATIATLPDQSKTVSITDHSGLPTLVAQIDGQIHGGLSLPISGIGVSRSVYDYEEFSRLSSVLDPDGELTLTESDTLGRPFRITNPTLGAVQTSYSGFDEVRATIAADGRVTCFGYDQLGRVTEASQKVSAGACFNPTTEAELISKWTYDIAEGGIGNLSSSRRRQNPESDDFVSSQFTYKPSTGLPASITTSIPGLQEALVTAFDYEGPRLQHVDYPAPAGAPFSVDYDYDGFGNLAHVRDAAGNPFWSMGLAEQGFLLKQEVFGNGIQTDYEYFSADAGSGACPPGSACIPGTIQSQQTNAGLLQGGAEQHLVYGYDVVGNLQQRSTLQGGFTVEQETFLHDGLGRLRSYARTVPGHLVEALEYTYSSGGDVARVDRQTEASTLSRIFNYGSASAHHLQAIEGPLGVTSYGYDDNGNQLLRTAPDGQIQERIFNEFDMPWSIQSNNGASGNRTLIDYDAAYQRVAKRGPEESIFYSAGIYECTAQTSAASAPVECDEHRFLVFADGKQVAQVTRDSGHNETQRLYVHTDHLGSSTLITDADGETVETRRYSPFGEPRTPINEETLRSGFTGHEHDPDLGLINMKGRLYDPEQFRFITPDPFVFEPFNPQGLNRYSYVLNSPLNFTDPSGFYYGSDYNGGSESTPSTAGCETDCSPGNQSGHDVGYFIDGADLDPGDVTSGGGQEQALAGGSPQAGGGAEVPGPNFGQDGLGLGDTPTSGPGQAAGQQGSPEQVIEDVTGGKIHNIPSPERRGSWPGGHQGGTQSGFAAIDCSMVDCTQHPEWDLIPGLGIAVKVEKVAAGLLERMLLKLFAAKGAAATEASVADKLARYLLNPSHPKGAAKARWFEQALGFTQANAEQLAKQIVFDVNKAVETGVTQFGTKFNQVIPITGANGRVIDVTFAWIRNNDDIVRLVTAIPTKL